MSPKYSTSSLQIFAIAQIDLFLEIRSDWIKNSDRNDILFTVNHDLDPRLRDGINEVADSVEDDRTLKEVMDKFAASDGYNKADVDYLMDATEDQFFEFFNSVSDNNVLRYVKKILELCNYNDGENVKNVGLKAKKSLQRMLGQARLTDIKLKQPGVVADESVD